MMVTSPRYDSDSPAWRRNSAAGRWYGLGRWYAMFPLHFARDAIVNLSRRGDLVIDPFCGRGNAPFAATVLGRTSFGIDIHPLAWLWTKVKLSPEPDPEQVLHRLAEIGRATHPKDRRGGTQFERMAWVPAVRAFLRAARRELDWKGSVTDRTLMAFVALHAQDKAKGGLSNQLSPTVAFSPSYAVRWWMQRGSTQPPDVDPVAFLTAKIERRYQFGVPSQSDGDALLGNAGPVLQALPPLSAGLLITSPPYRGVTDYWNDHWLRLWLLGYEMRKNWKQSARYTGAADYRQLLNSVFSAAQRHLAPGAAVLVRCDRRRQTADICAQTLAKLWPDQQMFARTTNAPYDGVSSQHGRGGSKAKEIDFILPGDGGVEWIEEQGFRPLPEPLGTQEWDAALAAPYLAPSKNSSSGVKRRRMMPRSAV